MTDDWMEYRQLVLKDLEYLRAGMDRLSHQVTQIGIEVERHKVKAGLLGMIAGSIPAGIAALILWIKHR